ncbi:MBOAT family O-acyltransferase [Ekhidna sp.]|uniref:MBOAT family O-acyltransferase n=1 Tax=Ekhidna sp. TaxID=2608089 RepID=UPI003B501D60
MAWKVEFIVLILASTLVDYYCGIQMSKRTNKKNRIPFLLLSLISNLGLLFTFKYLDLFGQTINSIFGTTIPYIGLVLPVGISFYTFQTLSYSIDIYRGNLKCEKHLGKFALYVSFFPQLVAGPIERASQLLPQFQKNDNKLEYSNIVIGITQMSIGFFKKVVVADTAALYVNSIYGAPDLYTGFTLWFATYLFAVQIYCDFSGYSDIAIGAARMMGYNLMENFRQPYFSKSITEFWQRWHISLSTWLRDYLYIPMGGNRNGKYNTYKNLMLTMLLGGLWHGASWNFVVWGFLNGLYLSIERMFGIPKYIESSNRIIKLFGQLMVFHLICLTWVFFRSGTFDKAIFITERMFTPSFFFNLSIQDSGVFTSIIINTLLFYLLEITMFNRKSVPSLSWMENPRWSIPLVVVLFMLVLLFSNSEGSQFIYFQF